MILSPDEIAVLIYAAGNFGPVLAVPATDDGSGHITPHVPAPGSPERIKLESWLDTAIAICLAESGGDTHANNPTSTAAGLWQILQSVHAKEIRDAQIQWETELSTGKNLNIYDARVNTSVAALVYQAAGHSWTPWSTYTSGAYRHHTGHGKAAYKRLTNKKFLQGQINKLNNNLQDDAFTVALAGKLVNPLSLGVNLPSWLEGLLAFVKSAGLVVGVFLLGLIAVILALWAIVGHSKGGKKAENVVKLAAVL